MAVPSGQTTESTVLEAIWRYKWLVLLLAFAFAGLGWLFASQTASWSASATIAVQDPRSTNLFDQGFPNAPERYVEGQAAILKSRAVARRSVEIAAEQTPPIVVTVGEIVEGLSVDSSDSSDIVTLQYTADTQRDAIGVVNSVAAAFQEVGRATADSSFGNAVVELDQSITDLQSELRSLEQRISDRQRNIILVLDSDPDRAARIVLLGQLIEELLALEPPPVNATEATVDQFSTQLQILNLRISTLREALDQERAVILAVERDDPERADLVRLQGEAQRRLTDLQTTRDQLAVDADLASNGVIFYSPAETAVPSGSTLLIVAGFLFGLLVGSSLAMLLSSRRQRFATRNEPELVLGARLLADVPNFKDERIDSKLPVIDAPTSASAEAFRFVSASISLQQVWPASSDGNRNFGSVISLSAGLSEGKTVITANTALAAAREGHKVLVVDADFGNQQLTELLLGTTMPIVGMSDVTAGAVSLQNAVVDVPHSGSGTVHLLSRGTVSVQAPDFFASHGTTKLFESLAKIYDLVIIDAPPLLRVAYTATLALLADRAMVVIAHGEDIRAADELRDQMELVGIPAIGYVYNFAPLRAEMTASGGSMADTLGEHPPTGEGETTEHSVVLHET